MERTGISFNSKTGEIKKFQVTKSQIVTDDEFKIVKISKRLKQLSDDFIQASLGATFDNIEDMKSEFKTLHNTLRALMGKEPREYK